MPSAYAKVFNESDVKAAFLYYFTYFISWPDQDIYSKSAPLKLCIFETSRVKQSLEHILASPKAANSAVELHVISKPAEVVTCSFVYIDPDDRELVTSVMAITRGKPILTVSDGDGFADAGGMIELKREENRVRVRINVDVISEHELKASSKLLGLAEIVSVPDLPGATDVPAR